MTSGAAERVRRPEWVAHVLDEAATPPRAVLLHLPSGRRTGLSDTATGVWQAIVAAGAEGIGADAIAARLAPRYGLTPDAIAADIELLIGQLRASDWVEPVTGAGDAAEPPAAEPDAATGAATGDAAGAGARPGDAP